MGLTKRNEATSAGLACVLVFALLGGAFAMEPVTFDTPASMETAFEVRDGAKTIPVTVQDLEALDLYRVTTPSPWEVGEATFEGVLFRDFLKEFDLADAEAVTVRALDDYTQVIPREDWEEGGLLLATRQDGVPLRRRTQGPTRLIYPLNDYPAFDTEFHKPRWVWMIESIERKK